MKETTKMSRTVGFLEKMFRELNRDSFNGELEEPIITVQATPNAYGHVSINKTWRRKDDWRHELNIAAGTLDRPIENVVATLIHEMTHLYNIKHDIQDCSRGGSYHNKHFKEEAEKHMIAVEKDEKYGWTITSPTEALLNYIIEKGWGEININRGMNLAIPGGTGTTGTNGTTTGTTPPKTKSNSRKYVCPKCKTIIRATKDVRVICAECLVLFELES